MWHIEHINTDWQTRGLTDRKIVRTSSKMKILTEYYADMYIIM